MGREIRMVPPNWEHPRVMRSYGEEGYQPLYDDDFESVMKEWLVELQEWLDGGFAAYRAKNPDLNCDPEQPYREFCEWHGEPPDPKYHRPRWKEEPTWFQIYETVSEGTPVTPPFATKEELVEYLVAHGDFWDQKRGDGGWERKNAEAFVGAGWAPSFMVNRTSAGVDIKAPRDGMIAE